MKCPICNTSIRESDFECVSCGELLTSWHSIIGPAHHIRQRGLVQASRRDYVGACVSFLEASLANPLDTVSLVDAAKALVYLGRVDDALRLLEIAENRIPGSGATEVAEAVRTLLQETERCKPVGDAEAVPRGERESHEPSATGDAISMETAVPTLQAEEMVKTTEVSAGPTRTMLGLSLMKRSAHWWSRLVGGERSDGLWATVLELEQTWRGDWGSLRPWLEAAAHASKNDPLFHYMLGLQWWQQGNAESATESFRRCLRHQPPVLNAGAYYLCLALDDMNHAQRIRHELIATYHYSGSEMQQLIEALDARLEAWDVPDWQETLRTLQQTAMH
ncbi:MAG: hypothetical protein GXP27_10495 [Planctomycetes bacterium]|nr:hypothetical protein [Planctomycetota bacterium]